MDYYNIIFFLYNIEFILYLSYNYCRKLEVNYMKNINRVGMIVLICLFIVFYLITTFFLDRRNINRNKIDNSVIIDNNETSYENEKGIVSNLYKEVRILYDVVNNKYKVDQEDTITIGDIVYKKITNFDQVVDPLFTSNGVKKYIDDLKTYFAYTENGYYLAGNLVSYQTYYFRGDNTNIYVTNSNEKEIDAIIYEKWTSNNRNTLATIKVVNENNKWLIDEIDILSAD